MAISVLITRDFAHMSQVAADVARAKIVDLQKKKKEVVLGLATGNSPTGLYKHLAQAANNGEFDSSRVRSFNLDEYVGLPGENAQQRVTHPESYCYFMIHEFFGLLKNKFVETNVPFGSLIEQERLTRELRIYPQDWTMKGTDAGKALAIRPRPDSTYLGWIRRQVLDAYAGKIRKVGGIDLQIIGVGGRGHVAFHESGIPFTGSRVMLVKLDDNTIDNAVADGHFSSKKASPHYAITMGAELVYQAGSVLLLANGERKMEPVTRSLLGDVTPDVPISYGQKYAEKGGDLIYVLDGIAARGILEQKAEAEKKGIRIIDQTVR